MSARALLLLSVLLAGLGTPARAEVRRISLFIGMDKGLDAEPSLKFASKDAGKMAGLFRQTGMYAQDDIVLLTNADLDKVRRAMAAIEASAKALKSKGVQTSLFVYFSGHGDSHSLHIQGQKLKRDDLVAWLNGLSCDLKIVVLDACESGDFLRAKGGRFLQDLPVQMDTQLKSQGVIIVTSTSRGELAQESDDYKGGVFTHHLANGLRGLADYNSDGWISLQESFEYSRRATATDMTMAGSFRQNPSFDLDLVGGSDPWLIPIDRAKSSMLLRNFPSGRLDIFDANSLDRVSLVWLSGADSLAYRIPTGRYLFRFRDGGREFLYTASVGKDGGVSIDRKAFQEKLAGAWTRKGGLAVRMQGMQSQWSTAAPFPGAQMGIGGFSYVTRTARTKETVRLGFGHAEVRDTATRQANDMDLLRLGYSRTYFLAGSRSLRMSAGGLAAIGLARQTLSDGRNGGEPVPTSNGAAPAHDRRYAGLYQLGAPFELEWTALRRVWISGEVAYSFYGHKDAANDAFRIHFGMEPCVQLGFHF